MNQSFLFMKFILYFTISIFLISSCNTSSNEDINQISTLPDTVDMVNRTDETPVPVRIDLIKKIKGEYFIMVQTGNEIIYSEPAEFKSYDIKIYEVVEESGYWEIEWYGTTYPIKYAEQKEDDIYLVTDRDDITFIFIKNENHDFWNFAEMGSKNNSPIVKTTEIKKYKAEPCTDMDEILRDFPNSWYQISIIDGEDAIFIPCEDAPGGIGIESGTIGFWNGSDPDEIVSISKLYNRLTIIHQSVFDGSKDTTVIHNLQGNTAQFGKGNNQDGFYVMESAKAFFTTINEECE